MGDYMPYGMNYEMVQWLAAFYARFPLTIPLIGTLGFDTGPGTDGVLVGTMTPQHFSAFYTCDYGAGPGVFVDDTADLGDTSGANDVPLWPGTPAANDCVYFGNDAKFCGMNIIFETAANTVVMTTVWEYYDGEDWATLTMLTDPTTGLTAGAGAPTTHRLLFTPPAAWTPVKVDADAAALYYIRCRVTAYTSKTTFPIANHADCFDLTHITSGVKMPVSCHLDKAGYEFRTTSGTAADTLLLLVNATQGMCQLLTIPKTTHSGIVSGLTLEFDADDLLAILQIGEDGTTEHANGYLQVHVDTAAA